MRGTIEPAYHIIDPNLAQSRPERGWYRLQMLGDTNHSRCPFYSPIVCGNSERFAGLEVTSGEIGPLLGLFVKRHARDSPTHYFLHAQAHGRVTGLGHGVADHGQPP